jgi:hypothetical protein
VGGAGSPSSCARELSAAEELERQRQAFDVARIHDSYRYLRQGCKPPHAFERHESCFDPGNYVEDEDIPMLAAKLKHAAPTPMAGDFVPDSVLGTVTKLVEDQTHRDADKKAEWLHEQAMQDACYIEVDYSE